MSDNTTRWFDRMLLKFTLDTNCLIDVAERRQAAEAVELLAKAHSEGVADVAVIAMAASERQKHGGYIRDFKEFQDRLVSLGMVHLNIILPMGYFDIGFWDHCLWTDDSMVNLERKVHSILFPSVDFNWQDYCAANGIDPRSSVPDRKWRNCKCDVQSMWSHIHHKRDVFVTSDSNFHKTSKKAALIAVGAGRLERPLMATELLKT